MKSTCPCCARGIGGEKEDQGEEEEEEEEDGEIDVWEEADPEVDIPEIDYGENDDMTLEERARISNELIVYRKCSVERWKQEIENSTVNDDEQAIEKFASAKLVHSERLNQYNRFCIISVETPDAFALISADAILHMLSEGEESPSWEMTDGAGNSLPGMCLEDAKSIIGDYLLFDKARVLECAMKPSHRDVLVCRYYLDSGITDEETILQGLEKMIASVFAEASRRYYRTLVIAMYDYDDDNEDTTAGLQVIMKYITWFLEGHQACPLTVYAIMKNTYWNKISEFAVVSAPVETYERVKLKGIPTSAALEARDSIITIFSEEDARIRWLLKERGVGIDSLGSLENVILPLDEPGFLENGTSDRSLLKSVVREIISRFKMTAEMLNTDYSLDTYPANVTVFCKKAYMSRGLEDALITNVKEKALVGEWVCWDDLRGSRSNGKFTGEAWAIESILAMISRAYLTLLRADAKVHSGKSNDPGLTKTEKLAWAKIIEEDKRKIDAALKVDMVAQSSVQQAILSQEHRLLTLPSPVLGSTALVTPTTDYALLLQMSAIASNVLRSEMGAGNGLLRNIDVARNSGINRYMHLGALVFLVRMGQSVGLLTDRETPASVVGDNGEEILIAQEMLAYNSWYNSLLPALKQRVNEKFPFALTHPKRLRTPDEVNAANEWVKRERKTAPGFKPKGNAAPRGFNRTLRGALKKMEERKKEEERRRNSPEGKYSAWVSGLCPRMRLEWDRLQENGEGIKLGTKGAFNTTEEAGAATVWDTAAYTQLEEECRQNARARVLVWFIGWRFEYYENVLIPGMTRYLKEKTKTNVKALRDSKKKVSTRDEAAEAMQMLNGIRESYADYSGTLKSNAETMRGEIHRLLDEQASHLQMLDMESSKGRSLTMDYDDLINEIIAFRPRWDDDYAARRTARTVTPAWRNIAHVNSMYQRMSYRQFNSVTEELLKRHLSPAVISYIHSYSRTHERQNAPDWQLQVFVPLCECEHFRLCLVNGLLRRDVLPPPLLVEYFKELTPDLPEVVLGDQVDSNLITRARIVNAPSTRRPNSSAREIYTQLIQEGINNFVIMRDQEDGFKLEEWEKLLRDKDGTMKMMGTPFKKHRERKE